MLALPLQYCLTKPFLLGNRSADPDKCTTTDDSAPETPVETISICEYSLSGTKCLLLMSKLNATVAIANCVQLQFY